MKEINLSGKIFNARLSIAGKGSLEDFCRLNDGKDVAVRVMVLGGHSTHRQLAYFRKVIVPEMRQAYYNMGERYTMEKTQEEIMKMCPAAIIEKVSDNGRYVKYVKRPEQLTKQELSEVIETIKQAAAVDFNHFIA